MGFALHKSSLKSSGGARNERRRGCGSRGLRNDNGLRRARRRSAAKLAFARAEKRGKI